jgi:hypothetical protein
MSAADMDLPARHEPTALFVQTRPVVVGEQHGLDLVEVPR